MVSDSEPHHARTDDDPGTTPADAPAWRGAELFEREDWQVRLRESEVQDLMAAVEANRTRPVELIDLEATAYPHLAKRMARLGRDLECGSAACCLPGVLSSIDEGQQARALWILARLIGTPLSQGADGRRLLEVRDEGYEADDPRFRGPHSNRRLSFHTDRCDVIGFACARPAAVGGETHVLHSRALRDALRLRNPAAAELLERVAFPYLRHTVDGCNERPFTLVPVFTEHGGRFAASLLRVLIDRADAAPEAPDLTADQRAALDTLEETAEDESLYAAFRLERGDVLFLNNWLTLHRRTAFRKQAHDEPGRLLYRVWLSSPASRELDPRFSEHFGSTKAGVQRGGMRGGMRARNAAPE